VKGIDHIFYEPGAGILSFSPLDVPIHFLQSNKVRALVVDDIGDPLQIQLLVDSDVPT